MNLRLVRLLCFFLSFSLHAQSELILPPKSKGKIPFESIANLMIIPISIEGVEMKFLVDTGVGRTLIFDTHKVELRAGDVLLEINGRKTHLLTLEKVPLLLQKDPGEKIRLVIKRQDHHRRHSFRLTSIFPN